MKKQKWLKDGFVVVGGVTVQGCVSYLQQGRVTETENSKRLKEKWTTIKTVEDLQEAKALNRATRACRDAVSQLGVHNGAFSFVPLDKSRELEEKLKLIEQIADEYNRTARCTSLRTNYLVYSVGGGDALVAKVMYDRCVDIASRLAQAVSAGDLREMRGLLAQIARFAEVLPDERTSAISASVKALREQARAAVKAAKQAADDTSKSERIAKAVRKFAKQPVAALRASLVETAEAVRTVAARTSAISQIRAIE